MFEYSVDGNHFLGVRKTAFGKTQMVYNFGGVDHRVYDVDTPNPPAQVLSAALSKAINSRRVIPTLISTLAAQNITLRESF